MLPCPICGLEGGFHDILRHREHEVPRRVLKEAGWVKDVHEQWKQEQADRVAKEVERQARLAEVTGLIDDDKEAWCLVFNDAGQPAGEWIRVKGSRATGTTLLVEDVVRKQPGE